MQLVNDADSEADIYDYFQLAHDLEVDVLVLGDYNRRVDQPEKYLWDHMADVQVSQHLSIAVHRKPGHTKRELMISIRFSQDGHSSRPASPLPEKDLQAVIVSGRSP